MSGTKEYCIYLHREKLPHMLNYTSDGERVNKFVVFSIFKALTN